MSARLRLPPATFAAFREAHAWAGVLSSLVLFVLFFLGAFAMFWEHLGPWQEPRLRTETSATEEQALAAAQRHLEERLAARPTWLAIALPHAGEPWLHVRELLPSGDEKVERVHPVTGERASPTSELGYFLYEMHFLDALPGGMQVAGAASGVMVFLIVTGLALLLGRRLLDLLRFRPRAKPRVAWSDAHKVLGLVTAPALLVFAWTGAQLCLIEDLARPSLVRAIFDGDEAAAARSLGMTPRPSPAGTPGELPDLAAALATAREALPDVRHGRFVIANLGDANVTVDVGGEDHATLSIFSRVRLDGSGAVTSVLAPGGTTTHAKVSFPFYGLHFAKWADGATRIAYAVLALLGALCILTGNLWWLARRGRRGLVDRLLARLTAGVCAGLALAVAVLFLANQLLPRDLASRPALEEAAFFTTWGLVVVTALVAPATRVSTHALLAAASLYAAVPLLDAWRHARLPLSPTSSLYVVGVELGLFFLCALLVATAWVIRRVTSFPTAAPGAARPHGESNDDDS